MKNSEVAVEVNDVHKAFRVYYDKGSMLKERMVNPGRNRYELREVLKGVSYKIYRGETVALIGENGCGKSTTLKLLTKILYPNSGTVCVNGKVSSLIELGAGFHPDMSGRENIYINASILGVPEKEVDKRIDDIIRFSELEEFIDNPVRTYSSGMYMRLAFSVAINVNADILLIDEILAVGDQAFQGKCINKLNELRAAGVTVILVSHSMGQIKEIADRCIWIESGRVVMDGDTETVCSAYESEMACKRLQRDEKEKEICKQKSKAEEKLQENIVQTIEVTNHFGIEQNYVGILGLILMIVLNIVSDVYGIGIESDIKYTLKQQIASFIYFGIGRFGEAIFLLYTGSVLIKEIGQNPTLKSSLIFWKKYLLPLIIIYEISIICIQGLQICLLDKRFVVKNILCNMLLLESDGMNQSLPIKNVMWLILFAPLFAFILNKIRRNILKIIFVIIWVVFFLFPGLDMFGQLNGGVASMPEIRNEIVYLFYFCMGYLCKEYKILSLDKKKEFFLLTIAFCGTVGMQILLYNGMDYFIKTGYFLISIGALILFNLCNNILFSVKWLNVESIIQNVHIVTESIFLIYVIYSPIEKIILSIIQKYVNFMMWSKVAIIWIVTVALSLSVTFVINGIIKNFVSKKSRISI